MFFCLIFTRESSHCTLQADKSFEPLPIILFELSHLQNCRVQIQKKAITQKASYDFFLIFTKYSTHHSLSANTGFKSLDFILFEILHLQNCDVKFQKFQRTITQKIVCTFLAHLSRRLIGELIVYRGIRRLSVRPSSVRQHFQTTSPLKP